MSSNALFSANNLGLEYDVAGKMVRGILPCDIIIPESKITIIFGASGSGKSSLLNVISGLQKPTEGSISFRNEDLYKKTKNELAYFRAHDLGIVYQTNYWVKSLSVLDNISMPLYFQGEAKSSAYKKGKEALDRVDMGEFANKYPILLSGGEQQRVAMARAIISDPAVIIADEPTGNLDSVSARVVMELLSDIHKLGNTVLMVTHNPSLTRYADRIIYMLDGSIVYDEATAVGEIPKRVQNAVNSLRSSDEEEKLANVSALMETMPGPDKEKPKAKKKKSKKRGKKK